MESSTEGDNPANQCEDLFWCWRNVCQDERQAGATELALDLRMQTSTLAEPPCFETSRISL